MTLEQRIKGQLGEYIFQLLLLTSELEVAKSKIAELEAATHRAPMPAPRHDAEERN